MTCQCALSLIEDYIDENLFPAEAEQLERHLEGCSRCREEFRTAQRLKQLLKQMPRHDPGRDYWSETARLIRARTTDVPPNDRLTLGVTTDAVGARRNALVRAVVSVAASLFILVSEILIGAGQDQQVSRMDTVSAPILATAPVSELLGGDNGPVVTRAEQVRLAKGMLLMGAPGFLGRFTGLPDLTTSGE
jgi:anti-sigma factor RsiW